VSPEKINILDEFSSEIIENRQNIASRLEDLASKSSEYRSQPVGAWRGTLPVVVAGMVDAMRAGSVPSFDVSPNIDDALERSSVTFDHLASNDSDTVRNAISKAKGAVLEIDVHSAFQAGTLHAPDGTDSVEQLSFTNPGADFAFRDTHGNIVALMNTKASNSYDIIAKHFSEHPNVNYVYATHEAATDAAKHGMQVYDGVRDSIPLVDHHVVVDTGLSAVEYEQALSQMVSSNERDIFGFLDGEGIIDNVPWITAGLVAYRAKKRHDAGMSSVENKAVIIRDVGRSGAAYGAAVLLQNVGVPFPATLAGAMFASASVQGVYRVKDQWQFLCQYDEMLADRLETVTK
jgi:hypothetical protein